MSHPNRDIEKQRMWDEKMKRHERNLRMSEKTDGNNLVYRKSSAPFVLPKWLEELKLTTAKNAYLRGDIEHAERIYPGIGELIALSQKP
jgi:hypothetical protein